MASFLTQSGADNGFWGSVMDVASDLGSQFMSSASEGMSNVIRNAGSQLSGQLGDVISSQIGRSQNLTVNPGVANPLNTSLGDLSQIQITGEKDTLETTQAPKTGISTETMILGGVLIVGAILAIKFA